MSQFPILLIHEDRFSCTRCYFFHPSSKYYSMLENLEWIVSDRNTPKTDPGYIGVIASEVNYAMEGWDFEKLGSEGSFDSSIFDSFQDYKSTVLEWRSNEVKPGSICPSCKIVLSTNEDHD